MERKGYKFGISAEFSEISRPESFLLAVSAFVLAFAEFFFASEFFIFERRVIRSNLLGKREFFLRGARLGRLANKGDPPTPNGAVHQVALPNQDIKMEAHDTRL
jgi:hypothetical protein